MEESQFRQQPAPQAPPRSKMRGPRQLCLSRRDTGFGFTLRHFLVYPPESYRLCSASADVRRNPDEPMETIFVKSVHPGSSAQEAGLATGDRLLSVNGEKIDGKSYASVVQTIQGTPGRLVLMVVPKEDDVIQQYYSMTAHHPKTNPRIRLRSPEISSGGSSRRDSSGGGSPAGPRSLPLQVTAEPIYHMPNWPERSGGGSRSSATRRVSDVNEPVISNAGLAQLTQLTHPGCRLSLDGSRLSSSATSGSGSGSGSNQFYDSSSTLTDDSLIHSRIRRSTEQKEEFLRSHVKLVYPCLRDDSVDQRGEVDVGSRDFYSFPQQASKERIESDVIARDLYARQQRVVPDSEVIAREFYARPQRMAQPLWPPEERGRTPLRALARIHEGTPAELTHNRTPNRTSFGANSFDSDPGESGRVAKQCGRSRSEEKDVSYSTQRSLTAPLVQMVSHRARQFESGQLDDDRIMHKSELARLTGKHAVPNVAERRQEFEQLRSSQERSGRGPSTPTSPPSPVPPSFSSGNRTVPIGSKHLHAVPPEGYHDLSGGVVPSNRLDDRRRRGRSVSTERWASLDESHSLRLSPLSPPNERRISQTQFVASSNDRRFSHSQLASPIERRLSQSHSSYERPEERDRLSPSVDKQRHKAVRQDSYLAAVKTIPGPTACRARRIVRRQPSLDSADLEMLTNHDDDVSKASPRKKRPLRPRKLSLRAASPLALPDAEADVSDDGEVPVTTSPVTTTARMDGSANGVVHRSKASALTVDERMTRRISYLRATADRSGEQDDSQPPPAKSEDSSEKKENTIKEGWLHCKVRTSDGKRAADRSWKQMYGALKGHELTLHKDRKEAETDRLDIRRCHVEVASDYKKRNNVLLVRTPADSEYLLQAEDAGDLEQWRRLLHDIGEPPQSEAPRSHSPSGHSPVSKARKPSQPAVPDPMPSPKSKTWKGKLGKLWSTQGGGSPSSPTYPEGASIGVPLDLCPPSADNPHVPLLVARCTHVVETLGLDIVGVYRVPGNTAQIAALTDAINKLGIQNIPAEDPRWKEVNVISSLVKSFFRNLPDPLFTTELYPQFICADKLPDPRARMDNLRKLINCLPPHNFETLKHVLYHLKKVVRNSAANKMESKNLAIVFGPTLVKAAELLTLVQDTAHQCRIIESLITNVDWFFSDDGVECLKQATLPPATEGAKVSETPHSASLLLNNLSKVGGYSGEQCPNAMRKDIMSSIISAASRVSKTKPKKAEKLHSPYSHMPKSSEGHIGMAAVSSIVTSVLPGVMDAEIAHAHDAGHVIPGAVLPHGGAQQPGMQAHDPATLERIRRFELETEAMLTRDPDRMKRATDWRTSTAALRGLETHITSPDLTCGKEISLTRKVGSYESLHDDVTSLKRFKSSREDCSSNKFGSLDSLQAAHADDGHDLVVTLTKTFDQKLQVLKSNEETTGNGGRLLCDDALSTVGTEKAEKEKQKSKEEEKDKDSVEENEREKETWKEWDARILMPRHDNPRVKRSESLNKADKPDTGPKVRRSESLGKADIKRTESLTKNEKTESNMKAKLKRSSSKEKENSVARLKRIKRRHTVGGTKDFDKLPWLDNRLYTEELERQNGKTRTSSPDLSTPKLRNSIANELISLGIEEAAVKAAHAQLTTPVTVASGTSRPNSMPPPLESQL